MEDFILFLPGLQSVLILLIVCELLHDGGPVVLTANNLVFHIDCVDLTLLDKTIILVVSNLTLFTCLELLPGFFFNHRCVGIKILSLQPDLFKFLGEPFFLLALLLLLLRDLVVDLKKAFLADSLLSGGILSVLCHSRCSSCFAISLSAQAGRLDLLGL